MSERLDFVLALRDRVSPGARAAYGRLGALRDLLQKAVRSRFATHAISQLQRLQKVAAQTHSRLASGLAKAGGAWEAWQSFGLQGAVVTPAVGAATALVGLAAAGAKWTLDAASFRDSTLKAYKLIEGTAEQALKTYERVDKIANETPFLKGQVQEAFQGLRGSGMSQREAEVIFAAASDTVAGQQDAAEKLAALKTGIIRARSGDIGALNEALQSAGTAKGVTMSAVIDRIAKERGKTADAVRRMIEARQLSGNEVLNAFVETAKERADGGNVLGTATKQFGMETIAGQWASLVGKLQSAVEKVSVEPFVRALERLVAVIDQPAVQSVLASWVEGMDAVGKSVGTFDPVALGEAIGYAARTAGALLLWLRDAATSLGKGFMDAIGPAADLLNGMVSMGKGNSYLREGLLDLAKATGYVLGAFVLAVAGIGYAVVWVAALTGKSVHFMTGLWSSLFEWLIRVPERISAMVAWVGSAFVAGLEAFPRLLAAIIPAMVDGGVALVQGLWQGIKGGWDGLLAGLRKLWEAIPESFRKALEIRSPSRRLYREGGYAFAGLVRSAEDNEERVQQAYRDVLVPRVDVPSAVGEAAPSAAPSGGVRELNVTINVTGSSADPEELAARIVDVLHREVRGLALATGAL